jgi:GNAT superfamily N-acetyltransferase
MPVTFRIREARLPDDKPAILDFIMALQRFEHAVEPDRRTDAEVAPAFFDVLMRRIEEKNGRSFIAEAATGKPLGWAAAHESENEIYVAEEERRFGWISELYVTEEARKSGVGRALIQACEHWARERGLKLIMIGALAGNARAFEVYRAAGYAPYATELRKYLR